MVKNNTITRLNIFISWIWRAPTPLYGSVIIFEALIYIFFLTTKAEHRIICGLALQVLGMLCAMQVLWKLQNDFGVSICNPFSKWWSSCPLRSSINTISASIGFKSVISAVTLNYGNWDNSHQKGSDKERIDKISFNIEVLHKNDEDFNNKISSIIDTQEQISHNIDITLEETKKEFREQLKQSFTQDIQYSITGLVLLFVGVIISTIAGI